MKLIAALIFTFLLTACSGFTPTEGTSFDPDAADDCPHLCEDEMTELTTIDEDPVEENIPGETEAEKKEDEELQKEEPSEDDVSAEMPTMGQNTETPVNNAILDNIQFIDYIVEFGDTISAIATRFGVSIADIQQWNDLEDVASIFAGQALRIGQDISVFLGEQSEVVSATVNYLLNEQDEKPEAARLHWSETFLNNLDLPALHQQFVDTGGNPDDVENFAIFLTQNAPIRSNWELDFKLHVLTTHQTVISRLEFVGGDDYQAYMLENGDEVPFAIVSSRTGHYIKGS